MKINENLDFSKIEKRHQMSKLLTGLFIIIVGVFILLDQLNIEIPRVLRSWEIILIMVGVVILVKHNFKNFGGYVLIIIGSVLMLNDFYPELIQMRVIWPSIIILFGISILIKAFGYSKKAKNTFSMDSSISQNDDSFFESSTFFGSIVKKINSVKFKGASITTVFGGTEFDLTQAVIEDVAIIDITAVFSGITLVIPPEWEVKSDLSSIFGGIDDKRYQKPSGEQGAKVLVLKGTCVFGGIDLLNLSKRK